MEEIPPRPEDAALFITVSDPVQHSEGMNKYTSYRVDVRASPDMNTLTQPSPTNNNNNNQINPSDPTQPPPSNNPPTPPLTPQHNPNLPNNSNATNIQNGMQQPPDDIFQNSGYSAVLRRYSDFLWLYERLHKERAGAIIPPLPEKQTVARFSIAFIEERRSFLERFLRRVAVHPELYDAPSLDTFLRADDVSFHAAKQTKSGYTDPTMMAAMGSVAYPSSNPTISVPPPKKDGIKKWFAETKTSISGDLVRSPDDDLFAEIESYIDGVEKQMKNVQGQATALVKKGKEIAHGLFEFGIAFNALGQSEADALGKALGQMGQAADELSVTSLQHSEQEISKFEEPLRDYIKTIMAVKAALQKRHDKRLTYTTCLSEVATKRTSLAKLRATPGMEAKAYGAEMSLKRGEANAEIAREDFATVSQRVLREVDRFKREKADDMRRMVFDYISLNIEYNKKMETVWSALLETFENVKEDIKGVDSPHIVSGGGAGEQVGNGMNNITSAMNGMNVGTGTVEPSNVSSTPAEQPIPSSHVSMAEVQQQQQYPHGPSPSQQYSYHDDGGMTSVESTTTGGFKLGDSVQYRDMNEPFAMPTSS